MTSFAEIANGRIAYDQKGQGSSLVLIHAAIADRRMWKREFEEYSSSYRILRYDVRGFGKSSKARSKYSDANDLGILLEKLGMNRVNLLAASNSVRIALDFALTFPKHVLSLVLVSGGLGIFNLPNEKKIQAYAKDFEENFDQALRYWKNGKTVEAVSRLCQIFCRAQTKNSSLVRKMILDNSNEIFTDASAKFASYKINEEILSTVNVPTLVLCGTRDHKIIEWASDKLGEKIPGAEQVTIKGADHLPNLSHPKSFDKHVLPFLERQTSLRTI